MSENFYENIRAVTSEKRKVHAVVEIEHELTDLDLKQIKFWIEDIEKHILKQAEVGKTNFKYDCSKLKKYQFENLSIFFKKKHKDFMVITHTGKQMITVDWSGKNNAQ